MGNRLLALTLSFVLVPVLVACTAVPRLAGGTSLASGYLYHDAATAIYLSFGPSGACTDYAAERTNLGYVDKAQAPCTYERDGDALTLALGGDATIGTLAGDTLTFRAPDGSGVERSITLRAATLADYARAVARLEADAGTQ